MIELLRTYAMSIVLFVGLGGVLLVSATGSQPPHAARHRSVTAVGAGSLAVHIGGAIEGPLRPGLTRHLDLTIRNPARPDVVVTSVTVSLVGIETRAAPPGRLCGPVDFTVRSGALGPLPVGAGEVVALSASGVPRTAWPSVKMRNRPVNQDGCRGAVLTLDYRAAGEVR